MTAGQQWTMNVPCNVQAASAARRAVRKTLADWGYEHACDDITLIARRAVRKTLADWGYEHACDDITLIVSELITNAVVHGAPDISCAISVSADLLIGEVVDHGSDLPHLINADDAAEHGRGLALVRAMTQSLGWCHTADGGKSVWFSYRLAEAS